MGEGFSESEPVGFIDGNDCPPIDTWFYTINEKSLRILYAWIPSQFVNLVEKGIEVNMLNTFNWIENFSYTDYNNWPAKWQ